MATFALRRLLDDQWEAEDFAGRLGTVAHAAFLHAGFVPYGESGHLLNQVHEIGLSAPSLSRRYTAPQLACRKGVGANATDVAVLELRRVRGKGDIAFQAYLLTGRRLLLSEAVMYHAVLSPPLCCRLAHALRSLETGSAGDWFWKPLAYWVLPSLFQKLCRRNDLPVTGFTSLPEDARAEILKRQTDGNDLARVECVSKQLRRLVTERDPPEARSSDEVGSWKDRYVNSRRQLLEQQELFFHLRLRHRSRRTRILRSRVVVFPPPRE